MLARASETLGLILAMLALPFLAHAESSGPKRLSYDKYALRDSPSFTNGVVRGDAKQMDEKAEITFTRESRWSVEGEAGRTRWEKALIKSPNGQEEIVWIPSDGANFIKEKKGLPIAPKPLQAKAAVANSTTGPIASAQSSGQASNQQAGAAPANARGIASVGPQSMNVTPQMGVAAAAPASNNQNSRLASSLALNSPDIDFPTGIGGSSGPRSSGGSSSSSSSGGASTISNLPSISSGNNTFNDLPADGAQNPNNPFNPVPPGKKVPPKDQAKDDKKKDDKKDQAKAEEEKKKKEEEERKKNEICVNNPKDYNNKKNEKIKKAFKDQEDPFAAGWPKPDNAAVETQKNKWVVIVEGKPAKTSSLQVCLDIKKNVPFFRNLGKRFDLKTDQPTTPSETKGTTAVASNGSQPSAKTTRIASVAK
jgi:hypothetical protein